MAEGENRKIIIEIDDRESDEADKKKLKMFAFSLGGENYCIDIAQIKEVIKPPEITKVPNTPEFVVGVINMRGDIVAVLDIRHFFGLEDEPRTKEARIIVSDAAGSSMGILADKVSGTIDIEEESIQPPLATLKGRIAGCTKGQIEFNKDILIYLDIEKVLRSNEIETLKKGG